MKKMIIALVCLGIVGGGAFLIRQNLPGKRFARHITKARLYLNQNNLLAARGEYKTAYQAKSEYTPHVSLEVLRVENALSLKDNNPQQAIENTQTFIELHPDNNAAKLILSRLAFSAGEFEIAFKAVNAILLNNPHHFRARFLLATIRSRQGRLDLAEEQMRILQEAHPDSMSTLMPLARTLLKQGKIQGARKLLIQILKKQPDNGKARLYLVDSYLLERKLDSAQTVLNQWEKQDTALVQPIRVRRARLYSLTNKLDKAEEVLSPYLKAKEENAPALSELAIVKVKQGAYDSAIAIYKTIGELIPRRKEKALLYSHLLNLKVENPAEALKLLSSAKSEMGGDRSVRNFIVNYLIMDLEHKAVELINSEPDSLRGPLNKFLSLVPRNKKFVGEWALLSYYQANRQKYWVIKKAKELYKQWPGNQIAAEIFAKQLMEMGQPAAALEVYQKMKSPSKGKQMLMLNLCLSSGKIQQALQLAHEIRASTPEQKGINALLAGLYQNKDKAKHIQFLKKELEVDPVNLMALNNLAWIYGVEREDYERARPYLDKLALENQMDPRLLDTVGWILAINGKYQEAEPNLRLAVNILPDHPQMLYHMGWLLVKMGEHQSAKTYLEKALSSKEIFEEKAAVVKLLKTLN
jgi:tetratricopeptide (TPR) repeat protein